MTLYVSQKTEGKPNEHQKSRKSEDSFVLFEGVAGWYKRATNQYSPNLLDDLVERAWGGEKNSGSTASLLSVSKRHKGTDQNADDITAIDFEQLGDAQLLKLTFGGKASNEVAVEKLSKTHIYDDPTYLSLAMIAALNFTGANAKPWSITGGDNAEQQIYWNAKETPQIQMAEYFIKAHNIQCDDCNFITELKKHLSSRVWDLLERLPTQLKDLLAGGNKQALADFLVALSQSEEVDAITKHEIFKPIAESFIKASGAYILIDGVNPVSIESDSYIQRGVYSLMKDLKEEGLDLYTHHEVVQEADNVVVIYGSDGMGELSEKDMEDLSAMLQKGITNNPSILDNKTRLERYVQSAYLAVAATKEKETKLLGESAVLYKALINKVEAGEVPSWNTIEGFSIDDGESYKTILLYDDGTSFAFKHEDDITMHTCAARFKGVTSQQVAAVFDGHGVVENNQETCALGASFIDLFKHHFDRGIIAVEVNAGKTTRSHLELDHKQNLPIRYNSADFTSEELDRLVAAQHFIFPKGLILTDQRQAGIKALLLILQCGDKEAVLALCSNIEALNELVKTSKLPENKKTTQRKAIFSQANDIIRNMYGLVMGEALSGSLYGRDELAKASLDDIHAVFIEENKVLPLMDGFKKRFRLCFAVSPYEVDDQRDNYIEPQPDGTLLEQAELRSALIAQPHAHSKHDYYIIDFDKTVTATNASVNFNRKFMDMIDALNAQKHHGAKFVIVSNGNAAPKRLGNICRIAEIADRIYWPSFHQEMVNDPVDTITAILKKAGVKDKYIEPTLMANNIIKGGEYNQYSAQLFFKHCQQVRNLFIGDNNPQHVGQKDGPVPCLINVAKPYVEHGSVTDTKLHALFDVDRMVVSYGDNEYTDNKTHIFEHYMAANDAKTVTVIGDSRKYDIPMCHQLKEAWKPKNPDINYRALWFAAMGADVSKLTEIIDTEEAKGCEHQVITEDKVIASNAELRKSFPPLIDDQGLDELEMALGLFSSKETVSAANR